MRGQRAAGGGFGSQSPHLQRRDVALLSRPRAQPQRLDVHGESRRGTFSSGRRTGAGRRDAAAPADVAADRGPDREGARVRRTGAMRRVPPERAAVAKDVGFGGDVQLGHQSRKPRAVWTM